MTTPLFEKRRSRQLSRNGRAIEDVEHRLAPAVFASFELKTDQITQIRFVNLFWSVDFRKCPLQQHRRSLWREDFGKSSKTGALQKFFRAKTLERSVANAT